jgi:uncharacterized protein YoxC
MINWLPAVSWLVQGAAQLPDTIVTKQVVDDPDLFTKVTTVASGLMTIAILVLTVALVPAAWNFRNSYKRVNKLLDRIENDIAPIVRHASSIADNVNYVTTALRSDMQQVSQTITSTNQKVVHAIGMAEKRLNDFNALLAVAQEEAESALVTTASGLRGARTTAERLRTGPVSHVDPVSPDQGLGSDGLRRAVEGGELGPSSDELDTFDDEEVTDGDFGTDAPYGRRQAPRVRPRDGRDREG